MDELDNPHIDPPMPDGYDQVVVPIDDPTDEKPANEDDDGVRHWCVIMPDGSEHCGGCERDWPCEKAVHLLVLEMPATD